MFSRVFLTVPLLYQQLFYVPQPPPPPAFVAAQITHSSVSSRTLYYQAKIAPPVIPAEPVVDVTPDQWLPRWQGPPYYKLTLPGGAVYAHIPPAPPAVDAINAVTSTTIGTVSRKTLFYQSVARPVYTTVAEDNTGTVATWLVQLSRTAPRPPTETALYTPFVPSVAPQPVVGQWLQPFKRQVAGPFPVHTQPTLPYTPVAVVVDVTPDQWLPRWQGPPRYKLTLPGGTPFVPKEAVLENTQTPDKWLFRFQGAVPLPPVHHTQPVFGYPYVAASNLTTTLEWMAAWRGPPRYQPPRIAAQPFVPREAVLENTVTPDKWLVRFAKAVPAPKPIPTQPVFGYPYTSQAIVVPYEQWWHQPLSRPAARSAVHNRPYSPFVPRAAVLENTQTPDKWLQRFQKAVPHGWPRYAAVVYPPYPYEAAANTVTPDKWLLRWQGPPRYRPPHILAQPFVPRAAVLENTVTPEKWLYRWQKAVPHGWPIHTQPFFGYPYVDLFFVGGPADETERIVCVPSVSRVTVPPDLLRTAEVPLQGRTATAPELLRVATVPEQSRVAMSNDYRDRPCHDT